MAERYPQAEAQVAWWRHNKRWFVPVLIGAPLLAVAIGFAATSLVVMGELKRTEPFQMALEAVRASDEVTRWTGTPLEPRLIVQGSVESPPPPEAVAGEADPPAGVANLMFAVEGPDGGAGVRAYATRRDASWTLHYLDAGVKADEREKVVVVIDDGERPAGVGR